MLNSFSENAITTKIRAMYGNRITGEQYGMLAHKKTVAQATVFLKEETSYYGFLYSVQPNTVHRGQLESLLRKSRFSKYLNILKYNTRKGSYYDYIMVDAEIEQILHMVRLLNIGKPEEYIKQSPYFMDNNMGISLISLADVKTFDDMVSSLAGTPYASILAEQRPVAGGLIDYTRCEAALRSYYFKYIHDLINKQPGKKTRMQLSTLFDTYIEITNINNILRIKRFFPDISAAQTESYLLPVSRMPKSFWTALCGAADTTEVLNLLNKSPYAKYEDTDRNMFVEYDIDRIHYHICRRYLRYSTKAEVVFSAYMVLSSIELSNITMIIEGLRYGVDPEEILKMIIYE